MLFDRQVLYLVFLFASTQAAPARNIPTTSTTPTASLDDSPSLSLDISPQLISSAAVFASQVVSAVLAVESSSNRSRSSTRHHLDDVSTSFESYPPVALQTTGIATPSGPKNPAVTSSSSTRRRSRTRISSTFEAAHIFALFISAQPTTTQRRPHSPPGTTEDQAISQHHTTRPRPTATHAAGVQAFHNSTRLNSTVGQNSRPANMTGATVAALGGLFTAIRQVGALSGSDPASATDLATATENSEPAATNALGILVSALPSSLAAPIQSQFSGIINPIESAANSFTSDLFGAGGRPSRTRIPPTTTSTSISSTSSSFTTTTTPTTTPTPLPPPVTTTDANRMPTQPSNTDTSAASATTTGASVSASNPSKHAAAIGTGVGVFAGVVILALAGVFLLRRRKQGKAPFKRAGSKHSNRVYPEVAWLYDPEITPPRSRAGSGSGAHLIPAPRPGSVEMGGTPVLGGASPEMRPARPSSPLLAPVVRGSRDMVGSRSRSGSEVDFERLRPLSTLREETPRGSMS